MNIKFISKIACSACYDRRMPIEENTRTKIVNAVANGGKFLVIPFVGWQTREVADGQASRSSNKTDIA